MRRLKVLDYLIFLAAAILCLCSFLAVRSKDVERFVMSGEEGIWIFGPEADERVRIQGPLGSTELEVRDGAARIVSSPCQNQTCVAAGPVRRPGQFSACLPNRVMLSAEGAKGAEDGVDGASW